MSTSDEKTESKPLPLTAMDWQIIVQQIVGLVTMGVTVIEVHPARWTMMLDAALRFGGPLSTQPEPGSDGRVTKIPLGIMIAGKPIAAVLKLWEPCPLPDCAGCEMVSAQGGNYPVPEEPSPLFMPGAFGRKRPQS